MSPYYKAIWKYLLFFCLIAACGRFLHESALVAFAIYGVSCAAIGKSGMAIAIEPMINAGTYKVDFMADGWGVRTKDRQPSAHYENTVLITDNGVEILTL